MKHIETIKSIALVILFTLSVTLATIYIMNTQRLTMAGESPLDLDGLLFLRGEGGEVTELERSHMMPEAVCYGVGGDMRCVYADLATVTDIYNATREMLIEALTGLETASEVTDREAMLSECTSATDFIYFKYHAPLPAPLILTSINGDTLSSQTSHFSEATPDISELFLIFKKDISAYSAVMICGDGRMLTHDVTYAQGGTVDELQSETLKSFCTARSVVKCSFSANADTSDFGGMTLSETAVVTESIISAPLLAVSEPITGGQTLDESMLRAFEFNPDRINTYNESESVSVYVEGSMTLRVEPLLIRYTASDGDGIEAARLLGYESYSGNYSIVELVGAAGSFIESLKLASGGAINGEAVPTLTSLKSEAGRVTLRFDLTFNGALIYNDAFEPIVCCTLAFEAGRLVAADICTLSFSSGIGSVASYTQAWTLAKLAPRLSTAVRSSIGTIEGAYVISSLGSEYSNPDITTASFEWVFVY